MKRRTDVLTTWPKVRVIHDKHNDVFRVVVERDIFFELDILNGSKNLSDLIKQKKEEGKTLRTAMLEIIDDFPKNNFQLKLDTDKVKRLAETLSYIFKEEYGLELDIKHIVLGYSNDSTIFVPIKRCSNLN